MSDTDGGDSKIGGRNRSGGGGGRGSVRQSFSHGRSKSVVVEKKRKRIITPRDGGSTPPAPKATAGAAAAGAAAGAATTSDAPKHRADGERRPPRPPRGGDTATPGDASKRREGGKGRPNMLRTLSDEEYARRLEALKQAKRDDEVRRHREAEDAKRRAAEEAERREAEEQEAKRREAEEAEKRRVEEEDAKRRAEEEAAEANRKKVEEAAAVSAPQPNAATPAAEATAAAPVERKPAGERPTPAAARPGQPAEDDRGGRGRRPGGGAAPDSRKPASTRNRGDEKRRSGKLTISKLGDDEGGRQRSLASMRRRQEKDRRRMMGGQESREKVIRDVKIPDAITVQELANRMAERVGDVIKSLMKNGIMATQNQSIDQDTAELIVAEFGHRFIRVSEADVEEAIETKADDEGDLQPRAPVITIMGHVDHGKTSLLDSLRKTNVVAGEAGGITQHIGAYQITTAEGARLTFLDTPGHAAFTSMRARGAQVTDIVVLVVAADDSVMPQTIEAINHAKAAQVPMIVAINKIDLPAANPDNVRQQLLRHEIVVESLGGDVLDVEVSAQTRQGLDTLLESITLQAELQELRAKRDRAAEGAVIEAKLDVGRGPVATVLIQRGTLRLGDVFVVGEQYGRVRALINDQGERVEEAGPSIPVEVLGLQGTPEAGDTLNVVEDEAKAREISEYRQRKAREKQAAVGARATLDQLLAQAKADEDVAELPVLVKADVQGSSEAIVQALEKIGNNEVRIRVLHTGVGAITESDVTLAEASNAPIIGFNVRANASARESSNQKGVEIRYYSIIYDLVDDVKAAAEGLLSPEVKENFIGYATIKQVFKVSGVGKVAGCEVTEGLARRSAGVRLLRDNVVIHEGTLKTLKRFKDEVAEVRAGQECGMAFENYEDIREADVIEIFERTEVQRTL
ncbi:MAG: translation initiation factor IF-2 [Pseudomonadota bacterium]